jgi:pimeloyl-ACP methyl ester carboxylesterase
MSSVALPVQRSRSGRARYLARLVVIAASLCLAAVSCGGKPTLAASSPPVNRLTVKPCTVAGRAARCGTLIVPEDRLTGKGRTIPVRFVVIPATGPDKAPDPVVYFAGGPGNSAVNDIPGELTVLQDLNVHRDLVFIEQRGTGQANPLNCPVFAGGLADQPALRASIRSCLAHLHGDLRFYTTPMYVDDVDQLLGDLRYAKVNLMGISYGTAVEQVFLLRHPERVRTMTMQSGSPLNVRVFDRAPGNSQLALDNVFARCQADRACHQAFPHLAADWAALWASVGKSPWMLPAAQSPTGSTQRFGQDTLADAAYQALYGYDQGLIPVVVHTLATATNKVTTLAALIRALQGSGQASAGASGDGVNQMMLFEIYCAEPWATAQPAALSDQRGSFKYQTDLESAQQWQVMCPLIPTSAATVGDEQLTLSTVPVLAFNGAADPIEQPRNWAGAQKFFPNSRAIALPGQGHDVNSASWAACADPLTQTFIDQASVAHLDTGCLASVPAPAFNLTPP